MKTYEEIINIINQAIETKVACEEVFREDAPDEKMAYGYYHEAAALREILRKIKEDN